MLKRFNLVIFSILMGVGFYAQADCKTDWEIVSGTYGIPVTIQGKQIDDVKNIQGPSYNKCKAEGFLKGAMQCPGLEWTQGEANLEYWHCGPEE